MLTPQENLNLINNFAKDAEDAIVSDDFLKKVGGLTIFAGIIDFLAIQIARVVEQVIIKEALLNNKPIPLTEPCAPHEDKWFYDSKISTRKIIKQVQGYGGHITSHPDMIKNIYDMCEAGEDFLNHRITVIHFVGNPRISKEKMSESVDEAIKSYAEFRKYFKIFREKIHPFTFSTIEREKFFSGDESKGIIVM